MVRDGMGSGAKWLPRVVRVRIRKKSHYMYSCIGWTSLSLTLSKMFCYFCERVWLRRCFESTFDVLNARNCPLSNARTCVLSQF